MLELLQKEADDTEKKEIITQAAELKRLGSPSKERNKKIEELRKRFDALEGKTEK